MEINLIYAKKRDKETQKAICLLALKHKLYSPQGALYGTYKDIIEGDYQTKGMVLATYKNTPIGLITIAPSGYNIVWIYVATKYRRNGVGKLLSDSLKASLKMRVIGHGAGTSAGKKFFKALKLI